MTVCWLVIIDTGDLTRRHGSSRRRALVLRFLLDKSQLVMLRRFYHRLIAFQRNPTFFQRLPQHAV
jgi:hypothetical protein